MYKENLALVINECDSLLSDKEFRQFVEEIYDSKYQTKISIILIVHKNGENKNDYENL